MPTGKKTAAKGVQGRSEAPKYTAKQIIDGLCRNGTEPNMLPDEADDIPGFAAANDRFDEKYWDLVNEFWEDFGRTASEDDTMRLYRALDADGPRWVAKGLRKKAKDDADESSSDETPAAAAAAKK